MYLHTIRRNCDRFYFLVHCVYQKEIFNVKMVQEIRGFKAALTAGFRHNLRPSFPTLQYTHAIFFCCNQIPCP